jgi:SAM-dependent methyltransferase
MSSAVHCRSCRVGGLVPFLDLGTTPLADALVGPGELDRDEDRFPLEVAFCPSCTLVQILEEVPAEKLFVENYLYFSSFSESVLEHARRHAARLVRERGLGSDSLVVEVASNDGYLLRSFMDLGVPVLGIDPSPEPARAAQAAGVPTMLEFFGEEMAERLVSEGPRADVIIANNVLAHVPDLNGFVAGLATLLAPGGVITIENPYVRDLVDHCEFDTIYHEHFCYYSCTAIDALMRRHGLWLNDVEYFPDLHGGTLRWWVAHEEDREAAVVDRLAEERSTGLTDAEHYLEFGGRVSAIQSELREVLGEVRASGKRVAGYGAAAKGATLLNSSRIGTDLVEFVVDRNPMKQGRFMPGTHQPILDPSALVAEQPDLVLLLAWNFRDEIVHQQQEYLDRGGSFMVPVPWPEVIA